MNPIHLVLLLLCSFFLTIDVEGERKDRLLGGDEARSNEIKYLVSLHRNGKHTCGGGIIHEKFILTAAHCVIDIITNKFKNEKMKIVAAVNDLTIDNPSQIEIDVEDIYVPSIYNGTYWIGNYPEGDIAVLKLKEKLDLSRQDKLQKLHLPKDNSDDDVDDSLYVNSVAVIAGYGWNDVNVVGFENSSEDAIGTTKLRLHVANAFVIDHVSCKKYWDTKVYKSNLCARVVDKYGDIPQGLCRGDSGSPLVYDGNIVIGVASGTILECNENITPSLYTRVSSYLSFINNVIKEHTEDMRVKSLEQQ